MIERMDEFGYGDRIRIACMDMSVYDGVVVSWVCDDYIQMNVYGKNIVVTWEEIVEITNLNKDQPIYTDKTSNDLDLDSALRVIRKTCQDQESCKNCPLRLRNDEPGICAISCNRPSDWKLKSDEDDVNNRVFR